MYTAEAYEVTIVYGPCDTGSLEDIDEILKMELGDTDKSGYDTQERKRDLSWTLPHIKVELDESLKSIRKAVRKEHPNIKIRIKVEEAPMLNGDGARILAEGIKNGKSIKEIADVLNVDLEIVKRTARSVIAVYEMQNRPSTVIDRLKVELEKAQ